MLTFEKEELVNSYYFTAVKAFIFQVSITESATWLVIWFVEINLSAGASASVSHA